MLLEIVIIEELLALCTGWTPYYTAANNFPAGAGQIFQWNIFWLGRIPFLAGQTSILKIYWTFKYLKLETLNFFLTSVNDRSNCLAI